MIAGTTNKKVISTIQETCNEFAAHFDADFYSNTQRPPVLLATVCQKSKYWILPAKGWIVIKSYPQFQLILGFTTVAL